MKYLVYCEVSKNDAFSLAFGNSMKWLNEFDDLEKALQSMKAVNPGRDEEYKYRLFEAFELPLKKEEEIKTEEQTIKVTTHTVQYKVSLGDE